MAIKQADVSLYARAAAGVPSIGPGPGWESLARQPTSDPYAKKWLVEMSKIARDYDLDADRIAAKKKVVRLEAMIDLVREQNKFRTEVFKQREMGKRTRLEAAVEMSRARIDERSKWAKEYGARYSQIVQEAHNRVNQGPERENTWSRLSRVFGVLVEKPSSDAMVYSPLDARFPETFREVIKAGDYSNEYVTFVQKGDITNFAVLTKAGEARVGSATGAGANLRRLLKEYNTTNSSYERTLGELQREEQASLADVEEAIRKLGTDEALSDQQVTDLLEKTVTQAERIDVGLNETMGVLDPEEAQVQAKRLNEEEINHENYLLVMSFLRGNTSEQEKERLGRGRMVSDPEFRAWARDHGYTNLGRAKVEKVDDEVVVSNYLEKSDDLRATLAWQRQSRRRPENYGVWKPSLYTGDKITIELKDGTQVFGERLKYHAGDRPGSIRVATAEGEFKIYAPAEMTSVDIVRAEGVETTRLDDYAERRVEDLATAKAQYLKTVDVPGPRAEAPFQSVVVKAPSGDVITLVKGDGKYYVYEAPVNGREAKLYLDENQAAVKTAFDATVASGLAPKAVGSKVEDVLQLFKSDSIGDGIEEVEDDGSRGTSFSIPTLDFDTDSETDRIDYGALLQTTTPQTRLVTGAPITEADRNVLGVSIKEFLPAPIQAAGDVSDDEDEEEDPEEFAEGGVAGANGEEEVIVGEKGPELVLPADITKKILALAAQRDQEKEAPKQAAEAPEPPAGAPGAPTPEADDIADLKLLQEGVAQRADGLFNLGNAVLEESGLKPTPSLLLVIKIVKLGKALTLNVSYMEEMLERARESEKMSAEWQKHIQDFNYYSQKVTEISDEMDKIKEHVDLPNLVTRVKSELQEQVKEKGGIRG